MVYQVADKCPSRLADASILFLATLAILVTSTAHAQQSNAASEAAEGMVRLNFPEPVELSVIVDYVSKRLGTKILYDEQLAGKKISIRAPGDIPVSSLLGILQSALKMKEMTLTDAGVPGWKRIVANTDLPLISQPGDAMQAVKQFGAGIAVTQAFPLKHISPQVLDQVIKPFLTRQGANTITFQEQRLLIVTDYASNVLRIARLIELIDRSGPEVILEFYKALNVDAAALAERITEVVTARAKSIGASNTVATGVEVIADERTNQLVIIGTRPLVDEVKNLLRAIDVPLGLTTQIYSFQYVGADRIDQLIQNLFDPSTIKRLYRSAVDEDDNLLITTASPEIHTRIDSLRRQLDVASRTPRSPVRFHKLRFADAMEVLQTLQAMQGAGRSTDSAGSVRGVSALGRGVRGLDSVGVSRLGGSEFVPGPNRPAQLGSEPTIPPRCAMKAVPALPAKRTAPWVSISSLVQPVSRRIRVPTHLSLLLHPRFSACMRS